MGNSGSSSQAGSYKRDKGVLSYIGNTVTNTLDPLGLFHEKDDHSLQGSLKNFGQSAISGVANTLNSGIDLVYDPFGDHGVVGDSVVTNDVAYALDSVGESTIKPQQSTNTSNNVSNNVYYETTQQPQLIPTPLYYYSEREQPRRMRGRPNHHRGESPRRMRGRPNHHRGEPPRRRGRRNRLEEDE